MPFTCPPRLSPLPLSLHPPTQFLSNTRSSPPVTSRQPLWPSPRDAPSHTRTMPETVPAGVRAVCAPPASVSPVPITPWATLSAPSLGTPPSAVRFPALHDPPVRGGEGEALGQGEALAARAEPARPGEVEAWQASVEERLAELQRKLEEREAYARYLEEHSDGVKYAGRLDGGGVPGKRGERGGVGASSRWQGAGREQPRFEPGAGQRSAASAEVRSGVGGRRQVAMA